MFQRFDGFQRRNAHFGVALQKTGAVGVDADMAQDGGFGRQFAFFGAHGIAWIGNRGAAEVDGVAVFVEDDFDDVGIHKFVEIVQFVRRGRHLHVVFHQDFGGAVDEFGGNQRLVALYVDDHQMLRQLQRGGGFGKARRAAFVPV